MIFRSAVASALALLFVSNLPVAFCDEEFELEELELQETNAPLSQGGGEHIEAWEPIERFEFAGEPPVNGLNNDTHTFDEHFASLDDEANARSSLRSRKLAATDPAIAVFGGGYFVSPKVSLGGAVNWNAPEKKNGVVNGATGYDDLANTVESWNVGCTKYTDCPYVEIDLGRGNEAFLTAVTMYHWPGRTDKHHAVEISLDGTNWALVYHEENPPVNTAAGNHVTFGRTLVRHVRAYADGYNNPSDRCQWLEIRLHGTQRDKRLNVAVSDNGLTVAAGFNDGTLGLYSMDAVKADGTWRHLGGGVSGVKVANDGTIYYLKHDKSGQVEKWTTDNKWHVVGCCVQQFDINPNQNTIIGVSESPTNHNVYKKAWIAQLSTMDTWNMQTEWFTHVANNYDGGIIAGVNEDNPNVRAGWVNNLNVAKWDNLGAPPGAKNLIEVAIGGWVELWVIDEHYELYHAWIGNDYGTLVARNWVKMNTRIMSISATGHGSLWGVSMDGVGVMFCRSRKVANFGDRCEYIKGPMGYIKDDSVPLTYA